jgi:hypothetical protein
MGLTIYYKGKFNPKASLTEMIREVCDISEIYKWRYHIFEKEFPNDNFGKKEFNEKIYGILFTPHKKSEPVKLCFLSNGIMADPFMFEHWVKSKDKKDKRLIYGNFTKTQYAGPDVHKTVIDLLRYLNKKYFKTFSLIDESKYWETKDETILRKTFAEWDALIDGLANALEKIGQKKGETIEETIIRTAKKVHSGRKKRNRR